MNESGFAARKLSNFFKIAASQVIVVHDELDLPFGRLRIKYGGGDNGHNGVISVHENLGSPDFVRLRVGVGRPTNEIQPADYVLSDFSGTEKLELAGVIEQGARALDCLVVDGIDIAQTRFNGVS